MKLKFQIFTYILKELLSPYILSLLIFIFTILMVQMFRLTDILLVYGSDLTSTSSLLKNLMISAFPIIIPLSFLSAILLGYGRLSQDSELVAFSSLGYRKLELLLPAVALCCLSVFLSFFCVTDLGPKGIRIIKTLSAKMAGQTLASSLKPGFFLSLNNMTVYVASSEKESKSFNNFFILDQKKGKQQAVVFADKGKFLNSNESGSSLVLYDGQIHFNPKDSNHAIVDFNEYSFATGKEIKSHRDLPLKALTSIEIREILPNIKNNYLYYLELVKRYQLVLVSVVFLFLGIAFGFNTFQRVTRSESLGFCIFFALAYWIFYFICESLAAKTSLIIFIYLPNLLFIILALSWMFFKNESFRIKYWIK